MENLLLNCLWFVCWLWLSKCRLLYGKASAMENGERKTSNCSERMNGWNWEKKLLILKCWYSCPSCLHIFTMLCNILRAQLSHLSSRPFNLPLLIGRELFSSQMNILIKSQLPSVHHLAINCNLGAYNFWG